MVTIKTSAIASHYTTGADGKLSLLGSRNSEVWEVYCLSTDTKPLIKVPNASVLLEMDTGDTFMFDADGAQWLPL